MEIQPTGRRLWRFRYTNQKKVRKISFGKYPVVSLADARQQREEARKLLQAGKDPHDVKKKQKEQERAKTEHTFEKIAKDWHSNRLSGWTENTARDILNRLEKDVFPILGPLPIASITRQQVIPVLKEVEKRGAFEIAKRLRANISRVFDYAIQCGVCEMNPASNLKGVLQPVAKSHFAAIKYEELSGLIQALDKNTARLFLPTRVAVYQEIRINRGRVVRKKEKRCCNTGQTILIN